MKTKILFIVCLSIFAYLGWNNQSNVETDNILILQNIEALASGEDSGPGNKNCYRTISEASSDDFTAVQVRDCNSCSFKWCTSCSYRALC